MKAAGAEHVRACETAATPPSRCRCKCGGRCHGLARVASGAGREAYEALPADDPHHLRTAAERRADRLAQQRRTFIEEVRRESPERAARFEARWFPAPA